MYALSKQETSFHTVPQEIESNESGSRALLVMSGQNPLYQPTYAYPVSTVDSVVDTPYADAYVKPKPTSFPKDLFQHLPGSVATDPLPIMRVNPMYVGAQPYSTLSERPATAGLQTLQEVPLQLNPPNDGGVTATSNAATLPPLHANPLYSPTEEVDTTTGSSLYGSAISAVQP
jgi:hypothetical protein